MLKQDLISSGSVEINAPPSKVWNGLTTPAIIKEWLFGTETVTDWKVGSEIIFQGEYQGHKYRDKGVILETVLHKKMSWSYWTGFSGLEDKPENYSVVTWTLASGDNKKTTFTWTQKGFANEEGLRHSTTGMGEFLKKIKEVVER